MGNEDWVNLSDILSELSGKFWNTRLKKKDKLLFYKLKLENFKMLRTKTRNPG